MRKNLLLEKATKLLLSFFTFLLLVLSIEGFGQTNIIPKLYLTSRNIPSGNIGWTFTNAPTDNTSTDYWKMINTNAVIISPAMNLDSYTAESLVIKLGTFGNVDAEKQTITVSISTNNGASWTTIGTRTPTGSASTAMTAFDLSSYVGTQVKVKFENLGGDASTGVRFYECNITGTAAARRSRNSTLREVPAAD
jgi:hypothetical protein